MHGQLELKDHFFAGQQSIVRTAGAMSEKRQTSKIFVGGLSWETTDQRLRTYFENYGAVSEAFVSFDRTTGKSLGLYLSLTSV